MRCARDGQPIFNGVQLNHAGVNDMLAYDDIRFSFDSKLLRQVPQMPSYP